MKYMFTIVLAVTVLTVFTGCTDDGDLHQRIGRLEQKLETAVHDLQSAEEIKNEYIEEMKKLREDNEKLRTELKDIQKKIANISAGELVPQYSGKALIRLLGHSDSNIRSNAMRILKTLADPDTIEMIISVAISKADPNTRSNALLALAPFKNTKVESTLIDLMDDPDQNIRRSVYQVCGEVGSDALLEPLLKALQRELNRPLRSGYSYNQEVQYIATSLGRFKNIKVGKALLKLLENQNKYVREYAGRALRDYKNREIVPEIITFLKTADAPRSNSYSAPQASLLYMLRQIGDPRGADAAIRFLGSRNQYVSRAAADALRTLVRSKHVPVLSKILSTGKSPDNKVLKPNLLSGIATALGELGDPRAAKALLSKIGSKDSSLAYAASRGLQKCVDPAITEELIQAWEMCKNSSVKSYLKSALASGEYPAVWLEGDNTFVVDKVRLEQMLNQGNKKKPEKEPKTTTDKPEGIF